MNLSCLQSLNLIFPTYLFTYLHFPSLLTYIKLAYFASLTCLSYLSSLTIPSSSTLLPTFTLHSFSSLSNLPKHISLPFYPTSMTFLFPTYSLPLFLSSIPNHPSLPILYVYLLSQPPLFLSKPILFACLFNVTIYNDSLSIPPFSTTYPPYLSTLPPYSLPYPFLFHYLATLCIHPASLSLPISIPFSRSYSPP